VRHMDQLIFWYTLVITPMLLLSGVFFPLEGLPPAIQAAAWFLPLHHLVEVTRGLILGTVGWATVGHVAWLLGALLLTFALPTHLLRGKLVR